MVACSCSMLFCSLQFYPGNYSDSFFPTFCTCPSLSFLLFLEYLAILKSFRELFGIFVSLPCSFLFYLLLSSKFCVIRLSSFAGDGFGYLFAPVFLAVCVFSCVICQIPYFDFLLDSTKVFFFPPLSGWRRISTHCISRTARVSFAVAYRQRAKPNFNRTVSFISRLTQFAEDVFILSIA